MAEIPFNLLTEYPTHADAIREIERLQNLVTDTNDNSAMQPCSSQNKVSVKLTFTEINILIILLDDFLENPMSSNINPTYIKKLEVLRKTLDNALPGDEGPYIEYPQH